MKTVVPLKILKDLQNMDDILNEPDHADVQVLLTA
jgi:hypothetical protein